MTAPNRMTRISGPSHGGLGLGFFLGGGWYRTRFDLDFGIGTGPYHSHVGLLRRFQPRNPLLAVLYWVVLLAAAVVILFGVFFLIDVTPFDQPAL